MLESISETIGPDKHNPIPSEAPHLEPFLGDKVDLEVVSFNRSSRRSRLLKNTLSLFYRRFHQKDGSATNRALRNVVFNHLGVDWRGPVLTLRSQGIDLPDDRQERYDDITAADFRDVIDFLQVSRGKGREMESHPIDFDLEPTGDWTARGLPTVKGVKIACDSEARRTRRYTAYDVLMEPTMMENASMSMLSKLAGMAVRIVKLTPPQYKPWMSEEGALENSAVKCLMTMLDRNKPTIIDTCMPIWQQGVGDILVFRDDHQELTPFDAELLCTFCKMKLSSLSLMAMGYEQRRIEHACVLEFSPYSLGRFREQIKDQKGLDKFNKEQGEVMMLAELTDMLRAQGINKVEELKADGKSGKKSKGKTKKTVSHSPISTSDLSIR